MPFTVPLTTTQRTNLLALNQSVTDANTRASHYAQAIIDGAPDVPERYGPLTITEAGLVLADLPPKPEPEVTP